MVLDSFHGLGSVSNQDNQHVGSFFLRKFSKWEVNEQADRLVAWSKLLRQAEVSNTRYSYRGIRISENIEAMKRIFNSRNQTPTILVAEKYIIMRYKSWSVNGFPFSILSNRKSTIVNFNFGTKLYRQHPCLYAIAITACKLQIEEEHRQRNEWDIAYLS